MVISRNFIPKRKTAFNSNPGNFLTVRDYTELLLAHFYLVIRSEHFDNSKSLSIEGCSVEIVSYDSTYNLQIDSYFSDDSR